MTAPTVAAGAPSAVAAVAAALDRIEADGRGGIWIQVASRDQALADAAAVDARVAAGENLPLAGRTLAVKGNIDVAGYRTTAGCPSYGVVPERSAPVVLALESAGAVVVGIANLDQFATGLVGTRSPYGICPNALWPGLISGGSSSGSAVAVASGLVDLGLGTDTAGSGRVPAAANGIVGLKPTRGRLSTLGVVPACLSLDCVAVFARTVDEAAVAIRIAASSPDDLDDPWRRHEAFPNAASLTSLRVGLPNTDALFFDGHARGREGFRDALARLVERVTAALPGVEFVSIDVEPFVEAGALLYGGSFVSERFAAVGSFISGDSPDLDPVVRDVIARSEAFAGWEVYRDVTRLQRLRRQTEPVWQQVDAFVVPSIPRLPTVAQVQAEPFGVNAMLGTYTNFVNLLDLAALTVPTGAAAKDGPPSSVTFIGPAWSDELLVSLASGLERGTPATHRTA